MKLSISNIAWGPEYDDPMYQYLKDTGYNGLEIAPTRVFPIAPYDHVLEVKEWAADLFEKYGLEVPSMQSIWFGHRENIFETKEDRRILVDYTKKAILFAETIGCCNIVFGNPRNRDTEDVAGNYPIAIDFFHEIGDFALEHKTIIAIEANPVIYNTHFLNTTRQAVEMAYKSGSKGVKINLDLGTVIYNEESIDFIRQVPEYINHVHISEPGLKQIEKRELHYKLFSLLKAIEYKGYVSIEMGNNGDVDSVKQVIQYIKTLSIIGQ